MFKQLYRWASLGLLVLLLVSCQKASLEAPGQDRGQGKVDDFSMEPNIRIALYQAHDLTDQKEPEITYGSMDTYFITLDKITYMVDWNDKDDFKNLKKGEKLMFRATGMLARKEKTGENFKVIRLNEK